LLALNADQLVDANQNMVVHGADHRHGQLDHTQIARKHDRPAHFGNPEAGKGGRIGADGRAIAGMIRRGSSGGWL
jgi:hypothetical protein